MDGIKFFILVLKSAELINKVNVYIRDQLYQTKQAPGVSIFQAYPYNHLVRFHYRPYLSDLKPINRCVTDIGSLHCALETPLQGLELLETAILATCGDSASKLCICLTVGANEIFDPVFYLRRMRSLIIIKGSLTVLLALPTAMELSARVFLIK
jgi:hypothetical protein